jgi:TetR/AcrR family transcriptional regulator, regulator of cefoperazone and chloramphenicol sensitivity
MTKGAKRKAAIRPRRPTSAGYARGEATRLRIIDTALDVFGTFGFDEASTRLIADRAGVNLASLHYYFAGKDGIYRACAEHIAAYGEQMIGPFLARLEMPVANPRLTRRQLRTLLHETLDGFADLLVSPREPPTWIAFVLREQMNPTAAYGVLHERVSGPLIGAVAALVGRLLFALGWPDFAGERLASIKAVLWDQALGALGLRPDV